MHLSCVTNVLQLIQFVYIGATMVKAIFIW